MKFGFTRFMLMNSLLDDGAAGGGAGGDAGAGDNGKGGQGAGNPPDDKNNGGNNPPPKTDNTNDDSWKSNLPDELKNDPTIKNLKNVEAMARMLLNGQKLIGKDKLVIPDASADDKQWKEAFQKLGLPESVDKYEFQVPEGADPEFVKKFKEFGHANNLLPKQAEKFMTWFKEFGEGVSAQTAKEDEQKFNSSIEALKREWGPAFDRKLANASGMFKQFADENLRKDLRESGFSNHPGVVKLMAKIAESFGDGKFIAPGGNGGYGLSPEEASKKIAEVQSKYPNHPYYDKNNGGHAAARTEMAQWHAIVAAAKKN
jgi:hypothetical protein